MARSSEMSRLQTNSKIYSFIYILRAGYKNILKNDFILFTVFRQTAMTTIHFPITTNLIIT